MFKKKEKTQDVKIKKKKWSKFQVKYFQNYFPFRQIADGIVECESGKTFLFFKINANNINLLSDADILMLHTSLANQIDQYSANQYKMRFIIQDAVFNIEKNVKILEDNKRRSKVEFIQKMMNELMAYLRVIKEKTTKKAFYLRITVNKEDINEIPNIQNSLLSIFKSTLNLEIASRVEIKQMLAIFANRIFADDYPDTELPVYREEGTSLFMKKKKSYETIQLPGIYEFKDMIVPATARFLSEEVIIGSNHVKTYAIKGFLGATSDYNLLSNISSISGVTTSIYIENLSTEKFKEYLSKDINVKNHSATSELDMLDAQQTMNNSVKGYLQIKENRGLIHYISTYFMLVAPTKDSLKILDEKFKAAINEKGITLDSLQLKQEKAYQACNPLGENSLGNVIKQNIPSSSTANLYPFNEPSLLDEKGLYLGKIVNSEMPVLFDPFTKHGSNKNILIAGISGSGKTVLMMNLMEVSLYGGGYLRNIDIEGTYSKFIETLGGIDINLSGNNQYSINILQVRLPDEIQKGIVQDYISEVRHWIATYKSDWNERKLDLFERYLTKVYKDFNITDDVDLKSLKPDAFPVLGDVYNEMKKVRTDDETLTEAFKQDLDDMLLGIESAVKGADAKVFNRHTYLGEVDDISAINFNMKDLMGAAQNKKMAQWLNVFTYISQFVNKNNKLANKILVGFDELSEILKESYTPLLYTVSSYERRFRKYGAVFLKATQQLDDVYEASDALKTLITPLLTQSSCKFVFHLGETMYDKVKKLLSLKDVELEKIKEKREHKCLMRIGQYSYDLDVYMPEWYRTVKADA